MNLLNWLADNTGPTGWDFQEAARLKAEKQNLFNSQKAASNYLLRSDSMKAPIGGTEMQDAPDMGAQLFGGVTPTQNTNPATSRVGANMQQAPDIGDNLFNSNVTPQTDTSQLELMKAVGPGNMLNSKLASIAKANEPVKLGPNDILSQNGRTIASNPVAKDGPADLELITALANMPDSDPRKAQLTALIKAKTQGPEKETWHTMTPAEVAQDNLPAGNYKKSSNGNVQTITTPQNERIPPGYRLAANGVDQEFVPGGPADPNMQSQQQKAQLGKLEADSGVLKTSLDNYKSAVSNASWDDFKSAAVGGLTKGGQRLKGAWTSSALMAKGQGLFELGVLSGPDMQIITGALKDPGSVSGQFASKDAYLEGINQVGKLLDTRIAEYRQHLGSPAQRAAAPAASPTAGWSIVRVK